MNTSFIIGYARPFSGNKPTDLPESYLKILSPEERNLHKRLLHLRDKYHAHSEADAIEVSAEILDFLGEDLFMPRMYDPFEPLSSKELDQALIMIEKLTNKIRDEQNRIEKSIPLDILAERITALKNRKSD